MTHSEYNALLKNVVATFPAFTQAGKLNFTRVIRSSADPFEDRLYLEEFIAKNRTTLRYPCFVAFSYNHSYEGEKDQYKTKVYNAMFAVLTKADKTPTGSADQFDNLDVALDQAETLAEQIIPALLAQLQDLGCRFLGLDPVGGEKSGPNADNVVSQSIYFSFQKRTNLVW